MSERMALPEGLARLVPGAALGAALSQVDRSRLNGHDAVTYLVAVSRQASHWQAELLAAIAEVAHCPPGEADSPVARGEVTEFSGEEIRLALSWTQRAVDGALTLALDVTERLPRLYPAMAAGHIDRAKAEVIARETQVCADVETARAVVDQVLPKAAHLTTGEIRRKVRRLVLAADPDAAAARQQRAVAERRVVAQPTDDGAATISVIGLPVERAATAWARVNAIAWAAKRDGDERSLHQLRADTVLALLLGEIDPAVRGTVELTVPLATLMGLAEEPGHLRGWGPVVADAARQLGEALREGTWRVSVRDHETAELLHHGVTRRRPTARVDAFVRTRDGTCRAKGCGTPARQADLDHTIDRADGGLTIVSNLGAVCRPHHRYKHEGGAKLEQPRPGEFRWTTPLGHTYIVRPDPDP